MSDKDSKGEFRQELERTFGELLAIKIFVRHPTSLSQLDQVRALLDDLIPRIELVLKAHPITSKEEGNNVFAVRLLGNALTFLHHHPLKIISSNPIGSAISLIEDAIRKLPSPTKEKK